MKDSMIPIVLFLVMGYVAWVVITSIRRVLVARLQAGVQARLLERFNTAESLMAYSETESGRGFLNGILEEKAARTSPYRSILSGVQAGILLIVFGIALLVMHHMGVAPDDDAVVFGGVPLALGIGFLLAAGATYVLSNKFGLLTKQNTL